MANLKVGTLLHNGSYRVVRFINSGGFGCTYEAVHTVFDERVAIKEFFIKDFCNRNDTTGHITIGTESKRGLVDRMRKKFIEEAKALRKLSHPGIVRVSDVFEENGTAYYVMDYIDGQSLAQLIGERGRIGEQQAVKYIRQVADALEYVHSQNRLHLDVKPGNILINSNGDAILIDFGASKQYDEVNGENTSSLVGKTPGYAPPEQMDNSVKKFTPCTDVYALGATLYKCLTGKTPPSGSDRIAGEELSDISASAPIRRAVKAALTLNKNQRPQSVADFLAILDGKVVDDDETVRDKSGVGDNRGGKRRVDATQPTQRLENRAGLNKKLIGAAVAAVAVVAIILAFVFKKDKADVSPAANVAAADTANVTLVDGPQLAAIEVPDAPAETPAETVDAKEDVPASAETKQETPTPAESKPSEPELTIGKKPGTTGGNVYYPITLNDGHVFFYGLVPVAGGTFKMGATPDQANDDCKPDDREYPVHIVTVGSFFIGETVVTQELWEGIMGSNPSEFKGKKLPVENVTYEDCLEFISKLNELNDSSAKKFRLPTEAEWEFAARGGNSSKGYLFSGSDNIDDVAWYQKNSGGTTHPVKQKKANELGLYDMSGNVLEWCSDYYEEYKGDVQTNPQGASSSSFRVLRGGGYKAKLAGNRNSYRHYSVPNMMFSMVGLRLVLD